MFFGAYALWYGKAVPGLPIDGVLEVKGGTAAEAGLWNPDVDTCNQRESGVGIVICMFMTSLR